ncbi:MAG: hypothetical protein L3J14_07420, partial [Flavobacteriaceae bacterium]|nr:hypothetical protein [Flavobacteriaceae bacterium]
KQFGIWYNDKRIENQALNKYNPNDIVLYYVSKLEKNAINYGKHYHQVDLYSIDYYNKLYSGKQKPLGKNVKIYLTRKSFSNAIRNSKTHIIKKDSTGYKTINNKTYVFQIKNRITRYWDMKGNGVDENGILLPELPNISKNATPKQLKEYEIAKKQFEEKHKTKIGNVTTNDGEKIQIVEVFESPKKQHATLEQIKEYNKLAKKYNSKSDSNSIIIKAKEISRIRILYNLMSIEQKQNAETYPAFPPTPPIKYENPMRVSKRYYTYTNSEGKEVKVELQYDLSLPPPPPARDATKAEKKNYQITLEKYKEWDKTKIILKKHSENELTILPPPPPKSQLDHIIEMAKKSADFYLEDKKISSDKAIDIIKNSNKMNVLTKKIDSNKPQVFISTQPIP